MRYEEEIDPAVRKARLVALQLRRQALLERAAAREIDRFDEVWRVVANESETMGYVRKRLARLDEADDGDGRMSGG